jgi:hypothetical protein
MEAGAESNESHGKKVMESSSKSRVAGSDWEKDSV